MASIARGGGYFSGLVLGKLDLLELGHLHEAL